jgi:hypothetical protein
MKRAVVFLHRYFGMALALFFLMWFASGLVLLHVPFPRLTPAERMAALPPLALERCAMTLSQALDALALDQAEAVRLGMLDDRPVYRILAKGASARWQAVFADTGERVATVDAQAVAAGFQGGSKARLVDHFELDQWTVSTSLHPYRPLAEVDMRDTDGTHLYVSLASAEVVRDTRRMERFWNWIGAIPHWIYPVQLRRHGDIWHHVVVWLSLPAVLVTMTGLYVGVVRVRFGKGRAGRRIPFREPVFRWHHVLGLSGALLALGWIFSGLMSMNPFSLFPSTKPDPQLLAVWHGGPLSRRDSVEAGMLRGLAGQGIREIEWHRLRGVTALQLHKSLLRADLLLPRQGTVSNGWDAMTLEKALRYARPGVALESFALLTKYDAYYYSTAPEAGDRPLPVARATFADGEWYYIDPANGRIVKRLAAANRSQRWLYQGLHSMDFPVLLDRPGLRNILITVFLFFGIGISATGVILGWRRFSRIRSKLQA